MPAILIPVDVHKGAFRARDVDALYLLRNTFRQYIRGVPKDEWPEGRTPADVENDCVKLALNPAAPLPDFYDLRLKRTGQVIRLATPQAITQGVTAEYP